MKKIVVLCFALSLVCAGCAAFQKQGSEPAPAPKTQGFNQAFYGFPDVPVPKNWRSSTTACFRLRDPTFKAGVIVFTGNVDPRSVESYYKLNMAKNGWKYINSFRYKDIVMNYAKEDKTCNIKISRGAFQTELEVWVGPADKGSFPRSAPPNGPK
jgi:hypothetical protein